MHSWSPPPSWDSSKDDLWYYFLYDLWGYARATVTLDWRARDIYWILLRGSLRHLWRNVESFAKECTNRLDWAVQTGIRALWDFVDRVWQKAWDAWNGLGPAIQSWGYTATSWADAKRDQVWDWARARYDDARDSARYAKDWVVQHGNQVAWWIRDKSAIVWDWIAGKGRPVWDWISEKAGPLWDWFQWVGKSIENWWRDRYWQIDSWIDTYQGFYRNLFDWYRNDLLDLIEDPVRYVLDSLVLSKIEHWLYNRWFARME